MIAIGAALVLAVAVGWWVHRSADRLIARSVRRSCLVTTKGGGSYRGVLREADQRSLVLSNVLTLDDRGAELPVDGEVLILRTEVAFVQLL